MVDQRLPTVDGDDGEWGEILNQFLTKEHYDTGSNDAANGGHKAVTIRAGTTGAGTAPLTFTSGSLMTTPEVGAVEFLSDRLYLTITTGAVRKTIAAYNDSSGATGDIYYRDSSGNFTRLGIGSTNNVLKVVGGLPTWSAASGGTPAGITGNIQYNDAGAFGGTPSFNYDPAANPQLFLYGEEDAYVTFAIKSRAMQSANLQDWVNSSDIPMLSVDPFGSLVFGGDSYLYSPGSAHIATDSQFSIVGSKSLNFNGSVSGTISIKPVTGAAGTYTLTLPTTAGNSNEYLKTNGSGVLSWDTPAGGGGSAVDSDQNIIAVGVFS